MCVLREVAEGQARKAQEIAFRDKLQQDMEQHASFTHKILSGQLSAVNCRLIPSGILPRLLPSVPQCGGIVIMLTSMHCSRGVLKLTMYLPRFHRLGQGGLILVHLWHSSADARRQHDGHIGFAVNYMSMLPKPEESKFRTVGKTPMLYRIWGICRAPSVVAPWEAAECPVGLCPQGHGGDRCGFPERTQCGSGPV